MNYLLLLAGGTGSRMKKATCPKQYLIVKGKPVFLYSLETFEKNELISGIVIVAHKDWHQQLYTWMETSAISKFLGFAEAGQSRQGSIYNGLKYLSARADEDDNIIIHDAARPLVSNELISKCLLSLNMYDGVMPVLPAKDTFYQSIDGKHVSSLLPRQELFAGQAPESFNFKKYLALHEKLSAAELNKITGSTEIALRNNLSILMIPGEELNFKVTTDNDMDLLNMYLEETER